MNNRAVACLKVLSRLLSDFCACTTIKVSSKRLFANYGEGYVYDDNNLPENSRHVEYGGCVFLYLNCRVRVPFFARSCWLARVELPSYNLVPMGSRLEVERLGNVKGHTILCFKGPITTETVFVFLSAVRREDGFSTVILDFSDVPYIDSSALGALVSAYVSRLKAGKQVILSGVSERVLKMLQITRVESLFVTFPTLDDAIGGLSQGGAA